MREMLDHFLQKEGRMGEVRTWWASLSFQSKVECHLGSRGQGHPQGRCEGWGGFKGAENACSSCHSLVANRLENTDGLLGTVAGLTEIANHELTAMPVCFLGWFSATTPTRVQTAQSEPSCFIVRLWISKLRHHC